jgi:hypothetical protein
MQKVMKMLACATLLAACDDGGAPEPQRDDHQQVDESELWAAQLAPRVDGDLSKSMEASKRYLETVPDETKALFAQQTNNPAFTRCFQLLDLALGNHKLERFDASLPYYNELMGRDDCLPRSQLVRRAAMAKHHVELDLPPDDPRALLALAATMVTYEQSIPTDHYSADLRYEIALFQYWAGDPDGTRMSAVLDDVDELLDNHVDPLPVDQIYSALTFIRKGAGKLGDAKLQSRALVATFNFNNLSPLASR